jgi:anti-sigma regulatory factor (Ser/Thr protein kinase)
MARFGLGGMFVLPSGENSVSGAGGLQTSKTFPRSLDALADIFGFIEAFFTETAIPDEALNSVFFVVEELFTNQVKYSRGHSDGILLEMRRNPDRLIVSLTDFDTERFDVREAPDAPTDLPLEQRRPGGLGIHLLKRMVDGLEYEYVERRGTTTFTKLLR